MPRNSPTVSNPEVNRAFEYVYKDINDLQRSVHGISTRSNRLERNGKDGDIRLYRDLRTDQYFLEGHFDDGWAQVELDRAKKNNALAIISGGETNVQSNWNQADSNDDSFIQNKPTVFYVAAAPTMGSTNSYAAGLVLAGASVHNSTFLRKDGTWVSPGTSYTHPNHSGDVTSVADGAQTIVADAVTYAKMQNIANDERILGRVSGANGVVEELTKAQVLTMINVADGSDTGTYNVTHSGEVTGATALTIVDNKVDEANLKISNSGSNGQFLQKQSGNTGGLTWATHTDNNTYGLTTFTIGVDTNTNATIIAHGETLTLTGGTGIATETTADGTVTITGHTIYSHPNHSGDVTSTGDGATVIGNNKVTLAMMAQMATASFLGRTTSSTGNVEVLSISDVETMLGLEGFLESVTVALLTDTTLTLSSGEVPDEDLLIYDRTGSSWKNRKLATGDIAVGLVTQHTGSIDHDSLNNFVAE